MKPISPTTNKEIKVLIMIIKGIILQMCSSALSQISQSSTEHISAGNLPQSPDIKLTTLNGKRRYCDVRIDFE